MNKRHPIDPGFMGIEGGGTHTTAALMDSQGRILKRAEAGPCNLRLHSDREILSRFRQIQRDLTAKAKVQPESVGVFVAGCRTHEDEGRLLRLVKTVWPDLKHCIGNDTHSAYAAALGHRDGVVILCGTGSIVRAQKNGKSILVGGWGHVGGDRGSGYWMGRNLLRRIFYAYDSKGIHDSMTRSVLSFLGLNTLEELVRWSLEAPKNEIASLTHVLLRRIRHPMAHSIVNEAVDLLASDAALASRKISFRSTDQIPVAIHPGLAKHHPLFKKYLIHAVHEKLPQATVFFSETEGAVGAAVLAASASRELSNSFDQKIHPEKFLRPSESAFAQKRNLFLSPTEQRNSRTLDLDRQSIGKLIQTMLNEETRTIPAIRAQSRQIEKAIRWMVDAFQKKKSVFYVGAGTSGRMGVLDAAECPPTFGCDPGMIQAIMAGGQKAVFQSMEAVEDNAAYGRQALQIRGVQKGDVVVGIAASGSTPFVLGALREAHRRKAKTILLTFNPMATFELDASTFIKIAITTGPEVITGSTRLKAGTATKLVLNMFSTISMIRLGKVRSNLMVSLDPSCEKLHDRAARIYSELRKISYQKAWVCLEKNGWNLQRLLAP